MLIHVDGPSGVGKSWLVAQLAKRGVSAIDMDDIADAFAMKHISRVTLHNRDQLYKRIGAQLSRVKLPPNAVVVGRTYDGPADVKIWLTAPVSQIQRQYHARVMQHLQTHHRAMQRYTSRPEQLEWYLFHRATMREGFPRMHVNPEPPAGYTPMTQHAAIQYIVARCPTDA